VVNAEVPSTGETPNHQEIISKVKRNLHWVSETVLGREDIIEQFAYALLTRNHQLLLGRTGVAKSMFASQIFNVFQRTGMRTFFIKASIEDTKDNYFGPIDIPRYRDMGQKVRKTRGSILEAHFAFIDEIFDTNEQILRDLMLILSDRRLLEGSEEYSSILHTVIAASNYIRLNEVTEAVIDRFFFRAYIPHETETFTQFRIDKTYKGQNQSPFSFLGAVNFWEIRYLTDIALGKAEDVHIEIPDDILYMKNIIIRYYIDAMRKISQGYYLSPRRQAKIIDFLRACAVWDGRSTVEETDLKKMFFGLCTLNSETGEAEVYKKVSRETLQLFNADVVLREQITFLTGVLNLLEEFKRNPEEVKLDLAPYAPPRKSWKEEFMRFVRGGAQDSRQISFDSLSKRINEIKPSTNFVNELKNGCLSEIQRLNRLYEFYTEPSNVPNPQLAEIKAW